MIDPVISCRIGMSWGEMSARSEPSRWARRTSSSLTLLHNVPQDDKPRIDLPGTVTVSLGLFGVVFGFNRAQVDGWTAGVTIISLVAGVVLLLGFVAVETRVAHPLMPLRVPAERNRGASFLAMLLSAAAMFGVFLFLTYYLQQNRGYSPIKTGLAFLPLTGAIMITAVTVSTVLLTRVGPKILVSLGMLLAGIGMAVFAQIGLHTSFASTVLIGELVMGVGLGLVFATAMNSATIGVAPSDAGVASALVNACQQVGGALGTALLSTIAASAATSFATTHVRSATLASQASIHGYTTAFWVAAALFAVGAVTSVLLYQRNTTLGTEPDEAEVGAEREPVLVA